MKKQMTKIAMMLILVTGLSADVARAQIDVGFYTGVETSRGTCEAITSVCYGNMFVLKGDGEWETHYLTLSLDYVNIPNHDVSGMGITGGNWSLVVFRDSQYFGTLYGTVESGNIIVITDYTKDGEGSRQVQASLVSTGGFGPFTEYKKIHGELSVISDLLSGETKGTASFNF